jgi:hypothetical protein
VLFSRGISAGQVVHTYKVLSEGGVRNVADAGKLEYQELWDKLSVSGLCFNSLTRVLGFRVLGFSGWS